jgi:peptidoglycan/LPS O-acetylase OafA/YrhL
MPQLDALRAVAVCIVVLWHFTSRQTFVRAVAVNLGVRLFFVLSGFLITALLLIAREDCRAGAMTTRAAATRFYVRRALRIMPIYYGTLVVAAAMRLPAVTDAFWWHVTYLSNVKFALTGFAGPASHFWTLAVEEQFYLVWPWIVLNTTTRSLRRIATAAILFAPLFRFAAASIGVPQFGSLLPFGVLDALAAGALMATYWSETRLDLWLSRNAPWFALSLLAAAAILITGMAKGSPFDTIVVTLETAVLVPIVGYAALGFSGVTGRVLESRPLRHVGKISYGIYVFHNFMPELLHALATRLRIAVPTMGGGAIALLVLMTIAVAWASWNLIERPLLRLKMPLHRDDMPSRHARSPSFARARV